MAKKNATAEAAETETVSDTNVGAGEPAVQEADAEQLRDNANAESDPKANAEGSEHDDHHGGIRESITAADDDEAEGDDDLEDEDALDSVDVGSGEVVGNGEIQSFVSGNEDANVGGDGVTGKSNDGTTMQSHDGATGADTHEGGLGIGTTPVAPKATTADALVASVAHPAKVEDAVVRVIGEFASNPNDKPVTGAMNLFDDLGMRRAELAQFAARLNNVFDTTLTVSEAQNFLLVRDVQNMMKRKLAVASALEA